MARRPNILFLMTDQHRHDGLGLVNPAVKTPNLDALAARGVCYTQTICNAPMCVPSRYSLMTGLYAFQNGVKHNTQMAPRDEDLPVPVLAERLREAGYQTAGIGKTHWYIGSRIMPEVETVGSTRGFEIRSEARANNPSTTEPGARYMAEEEPEWFEKVSAEMKPCGPGGESVAGYVGFESAVPPDRQLEGWLAREAVDFLEHGRDPERPFFLYVSLDYPHPGFVVPPEFEAMYDIADIEDAPLPDPLPGGHREGSLEDRWPAMTPEQRRRSRLKYYALCSYVDSRLGLVIDKLRETGELDNTFVMFTSDHGDMLGDRGRVSKYCLYEGSVRVPMIVAGPGVARAGEASDALVELVDVVPTLLDAAGLDIPDTLPGISLLSDLSRSGAFAEMHGRGYEEYQSAPAVMYRTKEWKLILHVPGFLHGSLRNIDACRGELYHLASDPLELDNLYDAPDRSAVRETLTRGMLMHVMSALGKFPFLPSRTRIRVAGPVTREDKSLWFG